MLSCAANQAPIRQLIDCAQSESVRMFHANNLQNTLAANATNAGLTEVQVDALLLDE